MAWTAPRTYVAGETLTAAILNADLRDNLNAGFPVGSLHYYIRAATTAETLIDGFALETNGVQVLRATYAALNTLLSGLGYPFGSGNGSTTFTLPDIQGRSLSAMASAGHADVNALGDSDQLLKASRTPKGSVGVNVSGNTSSEASHTHGPGSFQITMPGQLSAPLGSAGGTPGTYPVTGTSGAGSSHSHTFSGSGSGQVPGNYLVAGIYAVKT